MASFLPAYRLTIYRHRSLDATETTVLTPIAGAAHSDEFKVSTITSSGFKLYLGLPDGRRGRIDPLSKKTDVGEISIGILDVRAGGITDNLTRWMTAFLGDLGDQNQLGGCKAVLEESTNGGGAWSAFFTGRIASIKLRGKLWYDVRIRDASEQLKGDIFVGAPHPSLTYAQMFSQLPVGILDFYGGQVALTSPITGTTDNIESTANFTHISVSNAQRVRVDDVVTDDLWATVGGYVLVGFPLGAPTNPKRFTGSGLVHVKRLDTMAEGDFRLGAVEYQPNEVIRAYDPTIHAGVTGLYIKPLRYPIGVATGTPLVNNGPGYSAGATSIASDGWTVSITGILKQGDIVSFASHSTRYFITADVNSNGSGQTTFVINPALTASVPDNNAITVQSSPSRMAMPPNGTSVEFSITKVSRLREDNPNCLLINDVHPVTLWRDILDGKFGHLYNDDDVATGILLPAGKNLGDPKRVIPYDSTAFTALIDNETIPSFRAPITKAMPANEFIEEFICKPYGLGYYLNGSGAVVPVDLRFPATVGGAVTLTDTDLETANSLQWEVDATAEITSAKGTRYAEVFIHLNHLGTDTPGLAQRQYGPVRRIEVPGDIGILQFPIIVYPGMGAPLTQEFVYENSRGNLFDESPYEIVAIGLRHQTGETIALPIGSSFNITDRNLWAEYTLQGLMRIPQRPFGRGPTTTKVKCRRTANTTPTFPGTLHILTFTALPDPATNLRGGTRLVRCLERTERGIGIDFTFLDLGSSGTATAPTLGTPAQMPGNTFEGAQVAVTLNGSTQSAEVHYAVTATSVGTKPADTSAAWTPAQTIFQGLTVVVQNLPINSRVWWRARTFDLAGVLLPSAWAYPSTQFVDLATYNPPTSLVASLLTNTTVHLAWTNGSSLPIAMYLVTPTTDPLQKILSLDDGTTSWDLTKLTANTNYKAEVRHYRNGGETTGANTTLTTTNSPSVCPAGGITTIVVGFV